MYVALRDGEAEDVCITIDPLMDPLRRPSMRGKCQTTAADGPERTTRINNVDCATMQCDIESRFL